MTHPIDVAGGRDIVARWCELAEQRLEHLTELFESGRWRRYHSERDFLENVREAKRAVEAWRDFLAGEGNPDELPIDLSWIGKRSPVPLAKRDVPPEPMIAPQVLALPVTPPVDTVPAMAEAEPLLALDPVEPADSAFDKTLALTLDIVGTAQRYPLLSNAFQTSGRN